MTQTPAPKYADIGGRRLAYDEVTPPEPRGTILLLNGLGATRQGWARQMPAFGQQYRTIAMDHRDIGDSDPYEDPYAIIDQADDAAQFLHALNIDRAHVVGLSMGGFISLNLALRHPDVVQSLVLVSTSAGGATHLRPTPEAQAALIPDPTADPAERARYTFRTITGPGFMDAHPEVADLLAQAATERPTSPAAFARQYGAIQTHDTSTRLGEIHAPTLVIHGDADPLVPYGNGQFLASHIPNAHLITYPGVGHVPIIERADEFNRDVLNFIHGVSEFV